MEGKIVVGGVTMELSEYLLEEVADGFEEADRVLAGAQQAAAPIANRCESGVRETVAAEDSAGKERLKEIG